MERALAHNLGSGERSADVRLKEVAPFSQWLLKSPVKKGLVQAGYRIPTVIQASAIPVGKNGIDLIIRSKAGTGKTLIFCTILLETCYRSPGLHSLIITPTREIAVQIEMVLKQIAQYCKSYQVINTIGGTDVALDRRNLQHAKTVVGTPGRLVHLIESDILKTSDIRLVVLDEADQLYGSSHRENLEIILKAVPAQRQMIACSATFCNNLDEDLAKVMRNPLLISTKDQVTMLLGIEQYLYEIPEAKTSVLEMEAKVQALIDIFGRIPFKLCMLFAGSQSRAESYRYSLASKGWECDLISGGQKQARRSEIFKKFQNFQTRILVATDLMARGVDSEYVNLVINIEPPRDMVTYLHRVGRAGRFGSHGIAITLVSSVNDHDMFMKILGEIGCGMNIKMFPKTATDGKDENFLRPATTLNTEYHGEIQAEEVEENCSAVLRSKENLPAEPRTLLKPSQLCSSAADSNASLDTKTFCVDSKDSACNILPAIVADNKENLLRAEDTPTSNRSSVQLSANTIDDASSIAADSVFSSQLELNVPHPSLALDPAKNLDYCSFVSSELREAVRDEALKTDLFMDYYANVLKDSEEESAPNETELDANQNSLEDFSKAKEEQHNKTRVSCNDIFADYTNFITAEGDERQEETNMLDETSNPKDVSLQVCLGSLNNTEKEIEADDLLEQNNVAALCNEGGTDSQSYLQETVCASNGSYSADSEPSMESKFQEETASSQACEVDINSEPNPPKNGEEAEESDHEITEDGPKSSLVREDDTNFEPTSPKNVDEEAEESDHEISQENDENYPNTEEEVESSDRDEIAPINANIYAPKKSEIHDLWMKEYWRQVNFMQACVNFALDYHKQCDD